ncbi:helix-turn-helix domain-containing protein [Fusobacterium necrophorum]|uniref:helix-turn-helix domain-containing protein n=1 Tax=Fusobacterium necrophorum TaxID=859 RepID=UPI000786DFF7|nr:helix-turn-helix transcriptional regulator [Fusobacterium necrophorum]KYM42949.1 transcriptional regulator [Fusobacterium necrophorum subsp. funduliforme]KYM57604.1 transcriptional regulator [Fusobacterium necrophorum subsp. funduliforme]KYM58930.1 transcriptional regulator [Fusobacterium necrophorum subsp. funduliforme]MDK4477047.1 helix-turn-helix domain-containing protein [Fusobacterium necrophorum]MDK4494132.1 helix-turn-helix domain-containing protein [Fusobacterium necrophorum]
MTLGDRVKRKREELKLSQEELAEKMGYKSKTSIHKIEQNITDLPLSKVEELSKVLRVSTSYLMGWEEESTKQVDPIIEEYKLSPEEIVEFEKVMSINGALMFNGKEVSQEDKEELEQTLKRIFIRSLLLKRAKERDENGPKNY